MQYPFIKYQATGNDFIVFNNIEQPHYTYDPVVTERLCHRQFGIGADGIITLEKKSKYDFAFWHYNADGSKAGGLCGNGSRVALHYAYSLGLINQRAHFWTIDGEHNGFVEDDLISFQLQDVAPIELLHSGYFVNNGTRHYVEIVDKVMDVDIYHKGFTRRYMAPFEQEGINLNFVEVQKDRILVRTCECGLNTEPLSCGTGAAASALVAAAYFGLKSPIEVIMKGGKLWVKFIQLSYGGFSDIFLMGPVFQTFSGSVALDFYEKAYLYPL